MPIGLQSRRLQNWRIAAGTRHGGQAQAAFAENGLTGG